MNPNLSELVNTQSIASYYTKIHEENVAMISYELAKHLNLSNSEDYFRASIYHDIGKILVPLEILHKPGKLTPREFNELIIPHSAIGHQILLDAGRSQMTLDVALHHHEKFDGTGYPHKLVGLDIPYAARLIILCDIYEALRSERPYKKPFS